MSYDVSNILQLNLILTASGLRGANFFGGTIFADLTDGLLDEYFLEDTYRDYSSLIELAEDFEVTSEVFLIASRWFANIPSPPTVTVWMKTAGDTPLQAATKAENVMWRFWWFFKNEDLSESNVVALAPLADSAEHGLPITIVDANAINPSSSADLGSVVEALGNRFTFIGYKDPDSVATDPSQAYAMVQLAASFQKFNPDGERTAITAEYQVLPGIIGDDLSTTAYNALKAKKIAFFTQIELKGETDNSRAINTRSPSSYGEFMDDVVNLAILKNRLQVDGYNYITSSVPKPALDTRGYAGLLEALEKTCQQFYKNGVLGESNYVDIRTGETKFAKYGYVIYSRAEDVLGLTTSERADREYPATSVTVILARAGHTASINVTVE